MSVTFEPLSSRAPKELADLLFCQTCNRILTRHPRDVVDEIDAYYCPHSLDNMTTSDAMAFMQRSPKVFECPVCEAVLATQAEFGLQVPESKSKQDFEPNQNPSVNTEVHTDALYFFACGHCCWDSVGIDLTAASPGELIQAALQREKSDGLDRTKLLPELTKYFVAVESKLGLSASVPSPSNSSVGLQRNSSQQQVKSLASLLDEDEPKNGGNIDDEDEDGDDEERFNDSLWRWEDVDNAQSIRAQQALFGEPENSLPESLEKIMQELRERAGNGHGYDDQKFPQRSQLRTKRAIRCRQCMDKNFDNILVKGQINPLKGDSSIRTNVGQWFKKKSLAYELLPRIVVVEVGPINMSVVVTNPRDLIIEVSFDRSPWVRLDAHDEVEELDLITAAQPPKPSKPRQDDPQDLVLARFFNKVLLNLPIHPAVKVVRMRGGGEDTDEVKELEFRVHFSHNHNEIAEDTEDDEKSNVDPNTTITSEAFSENDEGNDESGNKPDRNTEDTNERSGAQISDKESHTAQETDSEIYSNENED